MDHKLSTFTTQPYIISQERATIVTCMDARIIPQEFMQFPAGNLYVLRNAGGRVTPDIIRSLIISHNLLGTSQFFVIHHTDCGMQKFTHTSIKNLLKESLSITHSCEVTLNQKVDTHTEGMSWCTIEDGLITSVIEDVNAIRNHPLIPSHIPIYGFVFDVHTHLLTPVYQLGKNESAPL